MRAEREVIDLTMRLDAETPVYPGDPAVGVEVTATFEDSGFFNTRLVLGSHNGTHIDAEGHMIAGGRMLDAYPLDSFRGRGVLLDVRDGADVRGNGSDMRSNRTDMRGKPQSGVDLSGIDEDCIVLLWTGLSDGWREPDYYARVPELADELVDGLIARGVKMVGVDAGSIDAEPFPVHKALLGRGILIAENLVGLAQLAGFAAGAGDGADAPFTVWALPLNVATEASPARVVAAFG